MYLLRFGEITLDMGEWQQRAMIDFHSPCSPSCVTLPSSFLPLPLPVTPSYIAMIYPSSIPPPSHFIYLSTSIRLSLAPQTDGLVGGAICDKRVRNLPTGCPTITSKCIIYKLHGLLFGIEYSCSSFYKTTLFIFK